LDRIRPAIGLSVVRGFRSPLRDPLRIGIELMQVADTWPWLPGSEKPAFLDQLASQAMLSWFFIREFPAEQLHNGG
jgi:hypothetical protein